LSNLLIRKFRSRRFFTLHPELQMPSFSHIRLRDARELDLEQLLESKRAKKRGNRRLEWAYLELEAKSSTHKLRKGGKMRREAHYTPSWREAPGLSFADTAVTKPMHKYNRGSFLLGRTHGSNAPHFWNLTLYSTPRTLEQNAQDVVFLARCVKAAMLNSLYFQMDSECDSNTIQSIQSFQKLLNTLKAPYPQEKNT
ncbi:MAG: hypothetical protein GY822_17400, partial [Deltaproteobacteria bacterium]|nr:hypothetical protein [Deltaproteobacteria bacterium]